LEGKLRQSNGTKEKRKYLERREEPKGNSIGKRRVEN
jgi:hypothetical protein